VLLDDNVVDFGCGGYNDNYGDWDGGDVSALTAGGLNLKSCNRDIIYVPSISPAGPSKRSLPLGFIQLSEDIKLQMLSKLDSNLSAVNVDSFGKDTLKIMLGVLWERRSTCCSMLHRWTRSSKT
jgi:hypothetical protein